MLIKVTVRLQGKDDSASRDNIICRLHRMASAGTNTASRLLLLLDNCEDAICGADLGTALVELASQVCRLSVFY